MYIILNLPLISYRDVVGTNTSDDSNKTLVDVSVACYFNLVTVNV